MRAPEFWHRTDVTARLEGLALAPLGWLYGASVAWKAARAKPFRARAKVVCIGNLTVGGSGKTPIAIAVAQALAARWMALVNEFTRGDAGITAGLRRFWEQMAELPDDERPMLKILSDLQQAFVDQALALYNSRKGE